MEIYIYIRTSWYFVATLRTTLFEFTWIKILPLKYMVLLICKTRQTLFDTRETKNINEMVHTNETEICIRIEYYKKFYMTKQLLLIHL